MLCKVNENITQVVYSHIIELLAGDHEEDILEDLLSLQDVIPWGHIEDIVIIAVVAVNDDDLVSPGSLWFAFGLPFVPGMVEEGENILANVLLSSRG